MTIVIYNGIELRDCETKAFDQTVETDGSQTDILFSRFKVRVASTLVASEHPKRSFGINPMPVVAGSMVDRMREVHSRLSQPRRDFWMIIPGAVRDGSTQPPAAADETILIAAGNATDAGGQIPANPLAGEGGLFVARTGVLDVSNGPMPKSVSVTEIMGGRAMRVEFEIEVCRRLCDPYFIDIKPDSATWGSIEHQAGHVLSNRWTLDETKDENWVTTRTLSGELRVAHHDFWPHFMRYLCLPRLLRGYRRLSQNFTDDPTGLVLKYRISDRQEHAAPPYPAIAWSGHHGESTTQNGAVQAGDLSIRLTGPPGVDKAQLIAAAGKVAIDRIRGLVPEFETDDEGNHVRTNYSTVIRNMAVISSLHEPVIELRCSVTYTGKQAEPTAFGLRTQEMGRPLYSLAPDNDSDDDPLKVRSYDPMVWPVPIAYDSTEPAGIFACYLQNPCSVWHAVPGGMQVLDGIPTIEQRPEIQETGPADQHPATITHSPHVLPPDENFLAEDSTEDKFDFARFPYQFFEIESKYAIETGWAALPMATASAGASSSFVRLHAPVARRIFVVTATRDGTMPILPEVVESMTDHNGIVERLEGVQIAAKGVDLTATHQSRRHSVTAIYTYLLARAPTASEKLRIGGSPFDMIGPSNNYIDLDSCKDDGRIQMRS